MITPLRHPKEAAQALGISVRTLNGFVQDGELRYSNVGRGKRKIRRMFAGLRVKREIIGPALVVVSDVIADRAKTPEITA